MAKNPLIFWERVAACGTHEWSPNYLEWYSCTCGNARERHCLKCGVYETQDDCGERAGMSGWGKKRSASFLRKLRRG